MGHSYRDLIAWQKAKDLSVQIYKATGDFPKTEIYGLTSQIRRASVSVAANIAEGQGRLTKRDFVHFLGMSRGSLLEVESHLAISLDLGFLDKAAHDSLLARTIEISKILNALMKSMGG